MNNKIFMNAFIDELNKTASTEAVFMDSFFNELEKQGIWPRRPKKHGKMKFDLPSKEGPTEFRIGSGRRTLRKHPVGEKGRIKRFLSPSRSEVLGLLGKIPTGEKRKTLSGKEMRVTVGGKAKRLWSKLTGRARAKRAAHRAARMKQQAGHYREAAKGLEPQIAVEKKVKELGKITGRTESEQLHAAAMRLAARRSERAAGRTGQAERLGGVAGRRRLRKEETLFGKPSERAKRRAESHAIQVERYSKSSEELAKRKLRELQAGKGGVEASIKRLQERLKPVTPAGKQQQQEQQKKKQEQPKKQPKEQPAAEPAAEPAAAT